MRLPIPLAIISILLFLCGSVCPRVFSQTEAANQTPNSTVSGRVTIKGKPAPGIVVGLRMRESRQTDPTFKATTDEDGKYRIVNVPSGVYSAAPVAPAFVIADASNPKDQTVVIAERESVKGIDFDLVRGGVITGMVTDDDGRPIVEERLTLISLDPRGRQPMSGPSFNIQTDDCGVYRMFGIPPGRYLISAGDDENRIVRGHAAHLVTFYPDVVDPEKASVVSIGAGTEAAKINITLRPTVQGFSVSGRIVDGETGQPVPNLAIAVSRIVSGDANNSTSYVRATPGRSDARGDFHLEKIAKGKYSVSLLPPPDSDLTAEPVTFDVADQDVTGILIKTVAGASISGAVIFEGAMDKNATAAMERAYIFALIRRDPSNASWSPAPYINRDGSFRLNRLRSGTATFGVASMSNFKGLMISRVERDGIPQPNGSQIQNAEHITGIQVFVKYVNGGIRGMVKLENGTLPPDGRLIIGLTKPEDPKFRTQPWVIDSRGHFVIDGLAGGTYELSVIAYAPEWRERPRTTKQTVTVVEGATTDVVVTIDLAPTTSP